jgi:hypothetical protein
MSEAESCRDADSCGVRSCCAEKSPAMNGRARNFVLRCHSDYVTGLWTFLPFDDLELHVIAFLQALVTIRADCAVVHENVSIAIVTTDEAESFRVIEPFDGPFQSHFRLPPGRAQQHPRRGC